MLLRDEKGSVLIAELLVVMVLLMALTFGGIDYWMMMTQFQQADHLKNQYLDHIRLNGCLDSASEAELRDKLEKLGFEGKDGGDIVISVTKVGDPSTVYTESNRAIRKVGDTAADIPEILFTIEGQFKKDKFWISSLLGNPEDGTVPFKLQGTTYSEYIERS